MDIRKYGIVFAVAILSAIFSYAVADAVTPAIDWNECSRADYAYGYDSVPVKETRADGTTCPAVSIDAGLRASCADRKGEIVGIRGDDNCITSFECSTCNAQLQAKQEHKSSFIFYTMVVLGLIFVVVGFLLPQGAINEWVGAGFILGGILSLFVGTVAHWSNLARIARPIVIALELVIVLYIVYRKVQLERHEKSPEAEQRSAVATTPARAKTRRSRR